MLSRLTLLFSIVMVCFVLVLLLTLTETGVRIGKLIDPPHQVTTSSDTIDIDTEIMRRLQRIGSFTGNDFVKSGDIRRD